MEDFRKALQGWIERVDHIIALVDEHYTPDQRWSEIRQQLEALRFVLQTHEYDITYRASGQEKKRVQRRLW